MAEALGDLVTSEAVSDGRGHSRPALAVHRGAISITATDHGSFVAMTLRLGLSEDETQAIANLPAKSRQAAFRLLQHVSCDGRTASFLDMDEHSQRLLAILLQQAIVDPDGSAATNQRIADGLPEIFVIAVRVYGAVARVVGSSPQGSAKAPRSDPGEMFR